MNGVLRALWPRCLALRLILFLLIALAVAQTALALLLSSHRDRLVEGLLHSQALNQAVTLARLLTEYPLDDATRLTTAFRSREACVFVLTDAPAAHRMSVPEQELSVTLTNMLHGISLPAQPVVAIEAASDWHRPCNDAAPLDKLLVSSAPDDHVREHEDDDDSFFDTDDHMASLSMDVPLPDGRWLAVRTRVSLPPDFDPATILSFLLSSAAVAFVVALVVRQQTLPLRALAEASERFGRGEKVDKLPTRGPAEVVAATTAFNTMQERLSEFLRSRMRLLAGISHDLRTPITTLRLKAEFIEDEAVREDVIKTIDELSSICEATLAFSRAEATTEDTKMADLGALVSDVGEEFVLGGKTVEKLRIDPVRCPCQPVALKRAVRNLVENAIRYGEVARVSVFTEGQSAVIRVDDQGPGIPVDRIADAFEPFVRLEPSRSTETGGIGLGLAVARGVVTAHGGTITLTNLPGKGLRAEIRLPLPA